MSQASGDKYEYFLRDKYSLACVTAYVLAWKKYISTHIFERFVLLPTFVLVLQNRRSDV